MLGLKDPWIAAAYLCCIGSAVLCVLYGLIARNRGSEDVKREDVTWAAQEKKLEEKA